ncbi:MAG TPA: hypothetical protein VMP01_05305 [Pirellulaceae bacterium]|nr:hypothetical protein [Pirellulaceae bacterium]
MSFRFRNAASVVAGTFNIYIVQPNWLAQVGILEEGATSQMWADLDRPGFRFRVKDSMLTWNVRPDRITLESGSPNDDCGSPLEKVIGALQWTPLMGVGTNLQFAADLDELPRLRYKCPTFEPPSGFSQGQSTWHAALVKDQHTFNFQIAVSPPTKVPQNVVLSINVHTEIARDLKQLDANAVGQAACRKFVGHCNEAVELAKNVFGMEIVK